MGLESLQGTHLTKRPGAILSSFLESTSNLKIIFQYIFSTALTKRPRVILSPFWGSTSTSPKSFSATFAPEKYFVVQQKIVATFSSKIFLNVFLNQKFFYRLFKPKCFINNI